MVERLPLKRSKVRLIYNNNCPVVFDSWTVAWLRVYKVLYAGIPRGRGSDGVETDKTYNIYY